MPVPPPVTMATFGNLAALVQLLGLDQPAGEAKPLEIEDGGQGLERRAWNRDGLTPLDVVDDVADALLLQPLLRLPGSVGLANDTNFRVCGEAAPGAVRAFGRVGDQAVRNGQVVFEFHGIITDR